MKDFSQEEKNKIKELIRIALKEDIGKGDSTTCWTVPKNKVAKGIILAKEDGVLCGIDIAKMVFSEIDPRIKFEKRKEDGEKFKKGDILANIKGNAHSLLKGERTALNFLQRLSGIATLTRKFVEKVKNYKAEILDTRKTTPGFRILEKYAVRKGGAKNHRMGLYDMVLVKDNHIKAAGGLEKAIKNLLENRKKELEIEVEVKNLEELKFVLSKGIKRIMLDNMDVKFLKKAVEITAGRAKLEASGGINLKNVEAVAKTGVDFISIGALTHSPKAVDISMELTT